MQKVEGTESTIEVFENDIDFFLHQFQDEQGIEDLRTVPQSVWNGCLTYIQRNVFKANPGILKSHKLINNNNAIMSSTYNAYNYDLIESVLNYYIYLCQLYNKEISIMGFSNLTNIDNDTIMQWGNENYNCNSDRILSQKRMSIYKKLSTMREESLSNKLADGKQNPVGVIAMLNRHYGWASPYTADANRGKKALQGAELPQLASQTAQIEDKSGID